MPQSIIEEFDKEFLSKLYQWIYKHNNFVVPRQVAEFTVPWEANLKQFLLKAIEQAKREGAREVIEAIPSEKYMTGMKEKINFDSFKQQLREKYLGEKI